MENSANGTNITPKLHIGFISRSSPDDRRAFSGLCYKMAESLREIGEVEWIPLRLSLFGRLLRRAADFINWKSKRKLLITMSRTASKLMYKHIKKSQVRSSDIIVAFFAHNYYYVTPKKISCPVIYFSDATFPAMVDYYPEFTDLFGFNIRSGCAIERECMKRVSKAIFSSEWARQSAIHDLNAAYEKTHVVEFGANIDDKDITWDSTSPDIANRLHILFLGVNWKRKGGDIAVSATRYLNENGIDAVIHIVGIENINKNIASLSYVISHGFLDKNIPTQYKELVHIISQCHCLLLPTLNECAGIAFAEASAYGLPIFTHRTGGVPNYVYDGLNGYMLPIGATGEDFGRKIRDCITSGKLIEMKRTARKLYEDKLNWGVWREKVRTIIHEVMTQYDS